MATISGAGEVRVNVVGPVPIAVEIEFIERVESGEAGSTATQTMNTTTPKTWVIFLLALSVLILIGYIPVIRARSKKLQ